MDFRIFVLICVLVAGMGQGVVAPKLPTLLKESRELALSAGASATLMYFGIFLSTFVYGKWADRGRVHWLLAPGLFFYALILCFLGLVSSPAAIFALRFLEGIAMSAVFVAADFVLGRLSNAKERGQWLSYYGVVLSIGLILGPAVALGSSHVARLLGASPEFAELPLIPLVITAAVAVLLSIFALFKKIPAIHGESTNPLTLDRSALASGAAYGSMEAGLVATFPVLAVTEFHILPEYCLFAIILSAGIFSLIWGILSDRRGPRRILILLLSLLAVGPLALALAPFSGWSQAVVSCALFGALAGGIYPVGFALLLEGQDERYYGYASGAFARAYGLGSLIGPLASGWAVQNRGATGLFVVMSIVGALGLAGMMMSRPRAAELK